VAVCDLIADSARRLAEEVGAQPYVDGDTRAMLKAHPELDAVLVCTPEEHHVEVTCQAAAAGKHVLVEKPLATSPSEASTIVDAVRSAGVMSMMGHSLRFDPRFALAQKAVARGDIGDIVHMYARRNTPLPFLRRLGGRVGGTYWVGVHDLDIMLWLKGQRVVEVFSRQAGERVAEFELDHAISSTLRFEDGSIAVLENIWGAVSTPGRSHRLEFQINGTQGQVEVYPYETGLSIFSEGTVAHPDTVYMPTLHGQMVGVYRNQIEHFVSSVLAGQPPIVGVEDGLATVLVADAIERSRAQGREVQIDWPDRGS
jgi:predicted dehydrogenase